MYLDRDYFEGWMQSIARRLDSIERICSGKNEPPVSVLPEGERLLDNSDLCHMLNVSKRTLQRYRSLGQLPYQMIYHKTFYKESDVLKFIEQSFKNFRKMKKEKK